MRVFKTTYKDRKSHVRKSSKWYVEFRDHTGALRRLPADTDKETSEDFGRKCERLASFRASHMPPDMELVRWFETLPKDKLRLLTGQGRTAKRPRVAKYVSGVAPVELIEPQRAAASKPLTDHLADFKATLMNKGTTAKQATLAHGRAKAVIAGCNFGQFTDIAPGRVLAWLNEQRKDKLNEKGEVVRRGISAQTFTFYVRATKQFCRWMQAEHRATENPIAFLKGLNVRTDRRHDRRALSVEEGRWLLDAARRGPVRYGMPGPDRAMLYATALETALRWNELRSLTVGSFHLDGEQPAVTVAAGYSKHRREDTQQLKVETAKKLREYLKLKLPRAAAFPMPDQPGAGAKMMQEDLGAARATWIDECPEGTEARKEREESYFLRYEDAKDNVADFHSLRHTAITRLIEAGVNPKVVQAFARHGTIGLTMDRYAHLDVLRFRDAVAALPDFDAPPAVAEMKATGTDATMFGAEKQAEAACRFACRSERDSSGAERDGSGQETELAGVGTAARTLENPQESTAEGEGFEPPEPCDSAVFKTAALNHSAIPPRQGVCSGGASSGGKSLSGVCEMALSTFSSTKIGAPCSTARAMASLGRESTSRLSSPFRSISLA